MNRKSIIENVLDCCDRYWKKHRNEFSTTKSSIVANFNDVFTDEDVRNGFKLLKSKRKFLSDLATHAHVEVLLRTKNIDQCRE